MEDAKILVIDDEKNILESIKMVLTYENYPVATTNNGLDGIDLYKQLKPDIVLLDVKMPGFNGLDVLKQLKDINEFSEIIMISGHSGIEEALEAAKLGAFDFLEKPISRDKLILTVRNAMEKVNLLKENFNLKNVSERKYELIGDAPAMQELRQTIRKVAKTNSTVLITGESGTGKELIARNIYILSSRKSQPFVQVNCAAIPEELIESELFGHEKGSFTGAYEKKIGKFDRAHKGSIFLDEVGDLSLKAQAKVLRVLEEGEIQRVGSEEIKKIDVRIITATNKNLKEEIKKGAFREDLFFRLNVVPVHSPALRERKEDIPQLVEHFITYFSEENNL
ncbi:MAG TPA: sigma-54 dependent transcriptional regulator, partial [Candidatus Kapabacteria bacterium]|nr:sigma-54 dependent transcriptional regulator [Candidatus Kapabacteria bacterium]